MLADGTALDDPHVYVQRVKWVRSGQMRRYFAAGCSCGWEHPKFRVTDERAVSDWFAHATAAKIIDTARAICASIERSMVNEEQRQIVGGD